MTIILQVCTWIRLGLEMSHNFKSKCTTGKYYIKKIVNCICIISIQKQWRSFFKFVPELDYLFRFSIEFLEL
jgi:hypothetical protein